jgi:predicted dehydrogenase
MKIAILGCGSRGRTYAGIVSSMPERYNITAACDVIPTRAGIVASLSEAGTPIYENDDDFFRAGKLADLLIIATQDRDHYDHALRAIELGYDILLEKPAATTLADCEELHRRALERNVRIGLCFVLRYTPFYQAAKSVIDSGRLGEIISMHASEGVEPFHQAHSYVRGHWRKTGDASPMLLAKCSHDTDLLCWFAESEIKNLSSYGKLDHFLKSQSPPEAPPRCTDGCPHAGSCIYDAHHYLTKKRSWLRMVLDGAESASDEQIIDFIRTSPWGRCVYHCDNDVVDHQVIAGEMRNGISITFSMTAFNSGRSLEIHGTKGTLKGGYAWKEAGAQELSFRDHATEKVEGIVTDHSSNIGYQGHGGGDFGLINSLDRMFGANGTLPSGLDGLAGHRFAFLAEQSRVSAQSVRSLQES